MLAFGSAALVAPELQGQLLAAAFGVAAVVLTALAGLAWLRELSGLAALGQAGRAARGCARQRRRGVLRAHSRGMGAAAVFCGRSGRGHIAGHLPGRALLWRHARRARARPPGGRRGRGRALRRRRAAARERDDAVRMDGHGGAQRDRRAPRRRIDRVGGIRPGADRRLAARWVARPRRRRRRKSVAPHRAARAHRVELALRGALPRAVVGGELRRGPRAGQASLPSDPLRHRLPLGRDLP